MSLTAAAIIAEPSFATDPAAWVNFAATRAAQAHKLGRPEQVLHWTRVAGSLVRAADCPHVEVGQVLGGLIAQYDPPSA